MKHDLPSFAVLIDADNVQLDRISSILEEITRHARITVRRIYGDFTSQNLAGWKTKLADHAIQPIQQYRNTIGKNASDSALIIDAMDLLHSRRFEGFCLVSSDSDFTRLATRIREDGLVVYGYGEKKAPKAFVNACDRYIYVENLLDASQEKPAVEDADSKAPCDLPEPTPVLAPEPTSVVLPMAETLLTDTSAESSPNAKVVPTEAASAVAPKIEVIKPVFKSPSLTANLLLKAYKNVADEHGWAMLSQLSSYIHANHSDFDPRTYGCSKFIDLLQKTELFELVQRAHKNGQGYFCRPKNAPKKATPPPKAKATATSTAYRQVLQNAVIQATSANGWAPISTIGQKLKALGRSVKESGRSTLTDALTATTLFDKKGSGAACYFRVKPKAIVGAA